MDWRQALIATASAVLLISHGTPAEAQGRYCPEVAREMREAGREVYRERREARRDVITSSNRWEARDAAREGAREVFRERREARREIRQEIMECRLGF